jgi:two-component system sensor histidine kinase LytS
MHDNLSVVLVQRIAIIAVIAYVFSQTRAFRLMFKEETTYREKAVLILFFSSISIAGTYIGIPIDGAIANVRDTGSIVAGLLGGPVVGTVTGLIAGIHRITLGGFSAEACGIATIVGGNSPATSTPACSPRLPTGSSVPSLASASSSSAWYSSSASANHFMLPRRSWPK